jgi:threonine dehydratase
MHSQRQKRAGERSLVDAEGIARACEVIRPYVRRTPVLEVDGAELGCAAHAVTLKLEQLQLAGSFKARGAFTNLLTRAVPEVGVVAASGGNHGAAVAYAARRLGVAARVFVPAISSPAKLARIRACGAELVLAGERYADALAASEEWAARSGALQVHAFDQPETLLGQGTLALELLEQAPALDTILVAVGGGGLIAGIAAWCAGRVRVVGVEPEAAPTLTAALRAGKPVDAPAGGIAADSLAPRRVGELVFPIARAYVERVVLVGDAAIRQAQRTLWDRVRVVAEPGGAAALAALESGAYRPSRDERVAVVVSGGNTVAVDFGPASPPASNAPHATLSLDGVRMRVLSTASSGEVGRETLFSFEQDGATVSARYGGGAVRLGWLVGTLAGRRLTFRYAQVDQAGRVDGGRSDCELERLPDGRIRLLEHFQWDSREGSGTNTLEQVDG